MAGYLHRELGKAERAAVSGCRHAVAGKPRHRQNSKKKVLVLTPCSSLAQVFAEVGLKSKALQPGDLVDQYNKQKNLLLKK